MKLTVKTLKGQQFEVQVDADAKILDVKKAIEQVKGADHFPQMQQKLIHQGKVLKDDTTLQESNVTESSFIVIMVVQPKPGQVSSSTPPAPAPVPAPAATSRGPSSQTPATQSTAASTGAPPPAEAPSAAPATAATAAMGAGPAEGTPGAEEYKEEQAASTLLAGSQLEATVQQILEMGGGGWDRATVLRALRAAFNNPERAIEYLYSGIPEAAEAAPPSMRQGAPAPTAAEQGATGTAAAAPAGAPAGAAPGVPNVTPFNLFGPPPAGGGTGAAAGAGALDFLRNSPQFHGLRTMVQNNPGMLQPMLQELAQANPELLRLINANQAEFMRLLNEPASEADLAQFAAAAAAAQGEHAPVALSVTPEEGEAISRLEALGFDRQLVIEAFFACDKNEQLAANYLLEHGGEFQD